MEGGGGGKLASETEGGVKSFNSNEMRENKAMDSSSWRSVKEWVI